MKLLAGLASVLLLIGCDDESRQARRGRATEARAQKAVMGADALSFRQLPHSAALGNAGQLHVADFNADGWPDIAAVSSVEGEESKSQVRIVLGDERSSFTLHQTVDIPFSGMNCVTSGDFNADGITDLAVAAHDSYNAWLLYGSGDGNFELAAEPLPMHSGSQPHTHSLLAADVNADGLDDLLSTCADDNAVAVQLQPAGGGFASAPGSPFAAGNHPYENLSTGDFNVDGHLDVLVANLLGATVTVLLGDGSGALRPLSDGSLSTGPRPGYAAWGDLNGDSALDIVTTHDDSSVVTVWYGDGAGGFSPAAGAPLTMPARCWSVAIADMDGDGRAELVAAEVGGDILIFPGGDYDTELPEPQRVSVAGGELMYLYIADLNADGKLELLVNFWDTQAAAILLQE